MRPPWFADHLSFFNCPGHSLVNGAAFGIQAIGTMSGTLAILEVVVE